MGIEQDDSQSAIDESLSVSLDGHPAEIEERGRPFRIVQEGRQHGFVAGELAGHGKGSAERAAHQNVRAVAGLDAPAGFEEDGHAPAALGIGDGQGPDVLARPQRPLGDRGDVVRFTEADAGPGRLGFDVVDVASDGQGVGLIEVQLAGEGVLQELGVAAHGRRRHADEGRLVLINRRNERRPVHGLTVQQCGPALEWFHLRAFIVAQSKPRLCPHGRRAMGASVPS